MQKTGAPQTFVTLRFFVFVFHVLGFQTGQLEQFLGCRRSDTSDFNVQWSNSSDCALPLLVPALDPPAADEGALFLTACSFGRSLTVDVNASSLRGALAPPVVVSGRISASAFC